jgi:hypothetical protein
MQARTRGAAKAATTAPRRRRGSSTRRRARARPPPRARRTTAWWMSLPTRGAARGAPPRAHMTNYTGTRERTQVYRRQRQLRPAEHCAGRGSTGLRAALRAPNRRSCASRRAPLPLAQHALRLFIPLGSPPRPCIHSCTEVGRTRAKSAPSCADLDVVPGISIPGVVGGVAGCLLAIVGAVILYKTWRASVVKRGDQKPLLYV